VSSENGALRIFGRMGGGGQERDKSSRGGSGRKLEDEAGRKHNSSCADEIELEDRRNAMNDKQDSKGDPELHPGHS